ncbi:MAG: zinc dependent phospholipase C family protein [Bacteroidota bacterium]
MLSTKLKWILSGVLICSSITLVFAWGFWAHKRINHMAVFTLPPEMIGFYKKNIDYITEHAVDPDKRRYAFAEEAPRHYIDLDHYGEHPLDSVPKYWNAAIKKYSEDTLNAYGTVPWWIDKMLSRLTEAFRERNQTKILKLSADIGHYIADSHVPLHCTENYNGQFTNQVGIHGFWESRVPELFGSDYDYLTGRATYIAKPMDRIWKIITESFNAKDSVLKFEAMLNEKFTQDRKYAFEQRGTTTMKVYSAEYTKEYSNMLDGMVERRLRSSILDVGSFWYTAWVNAGQPDLDSIREYKISDEEKKQLEEEDKMWKTGKVKSNKGHDEQESEDKN